MDMTHGSNRQQLISDELLAKLSDLLGLTDDEERQHLAGRAERYAKDYHFAVRRQQIVHTPGDTKVEARAAIGQIERLRTGIKFFETSAWIASEYKRVRRQRRKGHRPSLVGLHAELDAMLEICTSVAQSDPLPRGSKGNPILRHRIGAFIALFLRLTGSMPTVTSYRDGVKGAFLEGPAGDALLLAFKVVDPKISEASLAAIVKNLRSKFPNGVSEGYFHPISCIEDTGVLEVLDTRG